MSNIPGEPTAEQMKIAHACDTCARAIIGHIGEMQQEYLVPLGISHRRALATVAHAAAMYIGAVAGSRAEQLSAPQHQIPTIGNEVFAEFVKLMGVFLPPELGNAMNVAARGGPSMLEEVKPS